MGKDEPDGHGLAALRLAQAEALGHRLRAERDLAPAIAWPRGFADVHPQAVRIVADEERMFELARRAFETGHSRLVARARQSRMELQSLDTQIAARRRELKLVQKERSVVQGLTARQLTTFVRPIAIDRDIARLEGDIAALDTQIARMANQILDLELEADMFQNTRRLEAARELRATEARIDELRVQLAGRTAQR